MSLDGGPASETAAVKLHRHREQEHGVKRRLFVGVVSGRTASIKPDFY